MNGIKHKKYDGYEIHQYNENTAILATYKPFVEGFIEKDFKYDFKRVFKAVLKEYSILDKNYILFIDHSTTISSKSKKHYGIRVELYVKFLKKIPFKDKCSIINEIKQKMTAFF